MSFKISIKTPADINKEAVKLKKGGKNDDAEVKGVLLFFLEEFYWEITSSIQYMYIQEELLKIKISEEQLKAKENIQIFKSSHHDTPFAIVSRAEVNKYNRIFCIKNIRFVKT